MERIQSKVPVHAGILGARPLAVPRDSLRKATQKISTYRLTMGFLVLAFWLASVLGQDWDGKWHAVVGRDGFWTPPHWMFYSTVTIAGVICAFEVLTETFLYYKRYPGVSAKTATSVLLVFRGGVGFILAGFGMVVMLISAPFDDYYHRIFGIDVAIWTPFHVMLLLGIIMANLGVVYIFASEINRRHILEPVSAFAPNFPARIFAYIRPLLHPATLGLVLAALLLLTRWQALWLEATVGSRGQGSLTLGNAQLPASSLTMATYSIVMLTLIVFTRRAGVATLFGLMFFAFRAIDTWFSDWGIRSLALDRGMEIRGSTLDFLLNVLNYPLYSLLWAGLAIDALYLLSRRWTKSGRTLPWLTLAALASVVSALLFFLIEKPWSMVNGAISDLLADPGTSAALKFLLPGYILKPDYWLALPLVILIAVGVGGVAWALGVSLRYTER